MSVAALLSITAAALGLYVAALSGRFYRVSGWNAQAWFCPVALAASVYTGCNAVVLSRVSDRVALHGRQLQVLAMALAIGAGIRYTAVFLGRRLSGLDRVLTALLAICGAVALVPGACFSGSVRQHFVVPLGVYRVTPFSLLGWLAVALLIVVVVLLIVQFAAAWRAGVQKANAHCIMLTLLLVLGSNDILAIGGLLATPHLLDIGILVAVAAVGQLLTGRVIRDAAALQDLRSRLETLVTERTRQLGESQEAMLRMEKLVALGQLSAGVAHEINNPAAVVTANLRYLSRSLQESGQLPEDGLESLVESSQSMERIAGIVRHLLDASRIAAAARTPDQSVRVAEAVQRAVEASAPKCARGHQVVLEIPDDLRVLGEEEMLVQVLVNLLTNACHAIPADRADGRIWVRGGLFGEKARIVVQDNGVGMTKDLLRRVFEPFFSTKPVGAGLGLGLAVSRGLIAGLRGDLRLESEPGIGTQAIVELPAASPRNGWPAVGAPSTPKS